MIALEPALEMRSGEADHSGEPRIVLAHDYLIQMGGAERVVATMHRRFASSLLYTSACDEEQLLPVFDRSRIRTTFAQRLPGIRRHFKRYFPIYPLAFRSFSPVKARAVWVSASTFAKCLPIQSGTSFCYCYTPTRFLWNVREYVDSEVGSVGARLLVKSLIPFLRRVDLRAARRMNWLIAISREVQERIQRFYGRDAEIIYPPVDVDRFTVSERSDDYYLVVSRLVAYKGIDRAIAATGKLGRRLLVIGDGTDRERLKGLAHKGVTFLGRRSDMEVRDHLMRCRALIFPGHEDFGITPVEAQACGRPVIALARGGALETVIDGETGVLVSEVSADGFAAGILKSEQIVWDPQRIRRNAELFSEERFLRRMIGFMEDRAGPVG